MPAPETVLPRFEVQLQAPDLSPWRAGNTGVLGFTTVESKEAGPHVAITSLMHGNEIAGAIVLAEMLRDGLRPARGRLTLGFINLAAFDRFEPQQPTLSRFVDEDLNRLWDTEVLNGPRRSQELERAREIRPLIDTVDVLLDLHSMLWPSDPLILCGVPQKGRLLARGIGVPSLVVADRGHAGGLRMIDYARFSDPATPFAANSGRSWPALDPAIRRRDACHRRRPAPSSRDGAARTFGARAPGPALRRSHARRDCRHHGVFLRAALARRRCGRAPQHAGRSRRRR